jgi:hypothetical protein
MCIRDCFYTGQYWRFIEDSDLLFQEFLEGRLESASVPTASVAEYANDPRVKVAPAATTWRMSMNMFGTTDARDAYIAEHPELGLDPNYEPEPILSYLDFRQALYYGFDRYDAAVNVVGTYLPAHTYYASTYFLDAEGGISVRGTAAGQAVFDNFAGSTNGYVPDLAVALFKSAVADAIADGYYEAGTSDDYTVIELKLIYATSGNTSAVAMFAELVEGYEELLVDDVNFVRVDILDEDVEFPGNYYDYILVGATDLGVGGISGSLLDAPDFLQVYRDDNYGGFTMDWGIDTSTANIVVSYNDLEGEAVSETWSFNALVSALNGLEFVRDGQIQETWESAEGAADAAIQKSGETLDEINADSEGIAEYIVGDLEDYADDLEVEEAVAYVVTTEEGSSYLLVLSREGTEYSVEERLALKTDADEAMDAGLDANGADFTITNPMLLDDAGVAANAYLSGDYSTVAEIAEDTGAPLAYTEVYSIDWSYSGGSGSDAVVLLHIGDYYIFWTWL